MLHTHRGRGEKHRTARLIAAATSPSAIAELSSEAAQVDDQTVRNDNNKLYK